jgi:hypothetical protein
LTKKSKVNLRASGSGLASWNYSKRLVTVLLLKEYNSSRTDFFFAFLEVSKLSLIEGVIVYRDAAIFC